MVLRMHPAARKEPIDHGRDWLSWIPSRRAPHPLSCSARWAFAAG